MGAFSLAVTSYLLGLIHGLDTDHVTAVASFISTDSRPRRALGYGLRFASGHSGTVLVFSLLVLGLKGAVGEAFSNTMELFSGLLLAGLGSWVLYRRFLRPLLRHEHRHDHAETSHSHPHRHDGQHLHGHAAVLTGVITGLAGTAGVMLFGPVLAAPSTSLALAYIFLYGLGVVTSMALYSLAMSRFYSLSERYEGFHRITIALTGAASVALGIVWAYRAGYGTLLLLHAITG